MAEMKKTETGTMATTDSSKGADFARMTEDMRTEIAALREDLAQRGASLKSAAKSAARQGYAKGEETVEDVLAEIQSLEEELADATRRRPFAALGIAALIGFLVGVLFRR